MYIWAESLAEQEQSIVIQQHGTSLLATHVDVVFHEGP